MPITEKIVNFTTGSIADLIYASLVELNQYLGITTRLVASSSVYDNVDLKAQGRILDICNQEGATRYVNPIGGMELYDKPAFAEAGIELNFIRSQRVEYPQMKNEFVPWLSILDVLMFNDVTATKALLTHCELV